MKSILIVDSNTLCREALCEYIRNAENNYHVTGMGEVAAFESVMKTHNPHAVIFKKSLYDDLCMVNDVSYLHAAKIGIILDGRENDIPKKVDIQGVFYKTMTCKEFMGGIMDMLTGKLFYPLEGMASSASDIQPPVKINPFNLTRREKEVIKFLVKGASNKEIARALDLQIVTVKLHVRGICRKLGAQNRTQAALIAQEHGWI